MKLSNVYKEAAQKISESYIEFSCTAIWSACYENEIDINNTALAEHKFAEFFKPRSKHRNEGWFGPSYEKENQEHRETALLLMAEIAESEGL